MPGAICTILTATPWPWQSPHLTGLLPPFPSQSEQTRYLVMVSSLTAPVNIYQRVTSTETSLGFIFLGRLSFCPLLKKSKMLPPIPGGPPFLTPSSPYQSQSCLFSGSDRIQEASLILLNFSGSPPRSGCSLSAFFLQAFLITSVLASLGMSNSSQSSVVLTYFLDQGWVYSYCMPGCPPKNMFNKIQQSSSFEESDLQQMQTRRSLREKKSIANSSKSLPAFKPSTTLNNSKSTKKEKEEWNIHKLDVDYVPECIVGRDEEKQVINNFVEDCLLNRINHKVLYISGIPGVGKTASTLEIVNRYSNKYRRKMKSGFINALSLKQPEHVYRSIWNIISSQQEARERVLCDRIQKKLISLEKTHLIVIDQIDFLLTKDQKIFYNLFEWASQVTSKFGLIIIANTMNFPQKLSGRVNSRMGGNRLVFSPYKYEQIMKILEERLSGCNYFTTSSLTFASKKLSAFSSDMRTILDVLREAVAQHIASKKKEKIQPDVLSKLWDQKTRKKLADGQDETSLTNVIIDVLKKKDNECLSLDIFEVVNQRGVSQSNLMGVLKDMQEQGLVSLKQAKKGMFMCKKVRLIYNVGF